MKKLREILDRMRAHPGFVRYFLNTGWMFAEKALRLVAGLFVGAYVARYLGPDRYGLLNYGISLVALTSAVASLGMEGIVIRELVRNNHKREFLLGTAFTLRAIGAAASFVVLILVNETIEVDPTTKAVVYVIGCGTIAEIFGVIDYFFQSQVASKYAVWSQMIALAGISICRVVLVFNEADLVWFAWTYVLDFVLMALGFIFFYTREKMSLLHWRWDLSTARYILRDSWPQIFSALAVTVYLRIDQIMIKWMLGDRANGIYGVAVRLSELWNFIPMAVCSSVFPAILNARVTDQRLYHERLEWLYDVMVWLSIGIAIPMTFLSDWVVLLLFGTGYEGAGSVLAIYIWSSVFVFLGIANGKWLVSENMQVFRMVSLIFSCILNIVLNWVLIRSMGLNGSALATLVSYAFAGYFSFMFTRRTWPMFVTMTRSFSPLNLVRKVKNLRNP